jgi:hypothetical protein
MFIPFADPLEEGLDRCDHFRQALRECLIQGFSMARDFAAQGGHDTTLGDVITMPG